MTPGLRLLIDTNVWMDYFLDRSASHDLARSVILEATRREVCLLSAIHSAKDCFFLIQLELKRMERSENGCVSDQAASAIREVAWSCMRAMRQLSTVVAADMADMVEAAVMRDLHPDFEDNLIGAAVLRAGADHVVTSDRALLAHQPVSCITLEQALRLIA